MISRSTRRLLVVALLGAWLASLGTMLPAVAADATVAVVDNAFQPATVTVELGQTITFDWVGQNRHGVSGPWGTRPEGCSFATQFSCATPDSPSFVHEPPSVGTFSFNCPVHAEMTGSFTVVEASSDPTPGASSSPSTTPSPTADPSASPSSSASPRPSGDPAPAPAPQPSREPEPEPEPEPRFTVGPPEARETEPPVVVEGTAAPVPSERVTLEPFPDAPDPDGAVASEAATERTQDATILRDQRRSRVPRVVALGLVLGTFVAFTQFVLFGPDWVLPDQAA